jgi:hypothetical protein
VEIDLNSDITVKDHPYHCDLTKLLKAGKVGGPAKEKKIQEKPFHVGN